MSIAEPLDNARDAPPVALIAGPTASGKSDLAVRLALAARRDCTIINADSAQVYRDLSVLSARPSEEEMRGVPHRLFGTWDGATACSAADWARAARAEIDKAHDAHRVPILVGGTGLYLRTLIDGIAPVPPIEDVVRDTVRAMPVVEAYAALQVEDAEAAGRLSPNDTTRVQRALEVVRSTGKPLGTWHADRRGGIGADVSLGALVLIPDRDALYSRCQTRFEAMLDAGAIEEVEVLLARDLDPALPVMRAIGVREITAMVLGEANRDETIAAGAQATRNYAKRQYTWFRNQPPESWQRLAEKDYRDGAELEILLRYLLLT